MKPIALHGKKKSRMKKEVSLIVNDTPMGLSYFVQRFIDQTVGGMMASLDGTGEIKVLDISIEGNKVNINLNNALVPTNPFVGEVVRNTISGIVSSLKGVSEVNKISLSIKR